MTGRTYWRLACTFGKLGWGGRDVLNELGQRINEAWDEAAGNKHSDRFAVTLGHRGEETDHDVSVGPCAYDDAVCPYKRKVLADPWIEISLLGLLRLIRIGHTFCSQMVRVLWALDRFTAGMGCCRPEAVVN